MTRIVKVKIYRYVGGKTIVLILKGALLHMIILLYRKDFKNGVAKSHNNYQLL